MYIESNREDFLDIQELINNSKYKNKKHDLFLIRDYITNFINDSDELHDLISELRQKAFNQYMENE